MSDSNRPRVVIVGAGFGGLWAARKLARHQVDVTVVDKNNYHTFFPLLYQVAAAELEPEDIIYPVRSILRRRHNVSFRLGEVRGIDYTSRTLMMAQGKNIPYDYLLLSLGSKEYFYRVAGADKFAYALKNLEHAIQLRNHILCCFESAFYEADPERRKQLLTFTIVGGGPTGVEFTGALTELVRVPLVKDYPSLDFTQVRVLLLEASNRLLTGLPSRLDRYTQKRFARMGVEVLLNSTVSQVSADSVTLKDGQVIPTATVVWTAGVQGEGLPSEWDFPTRSNGQVDVLPTLQAPGHPEIYITGDLAHIEQDGHSLLQVAPVATQQGEWAAKNILHQVAGEQPLPFRYHDPGMMVTIGRNAAAVQLGRLPITGFPAWLIWLGVHLYRLIGFRNRLVVLLSWAWDYLFFERVVRLITPVKDNELEHEGC
jgi:NADH dehydrogenase